MNDLPKLSARIDPSPEIQQQIAATIRMCREWQPVHVDAKQYRESTEAAACSALINPPDYYSIILYQALPIGAIIGIAGFIILRGIYRFGFDVIRTLRRGNPVFKSGYPRRASDKPDAHGSPYNVSK